MNKKLIFGLLGLAAAGGIGYYLWHKANATVTSPTLLPATATTPGSTTVATQTTAPTPAKPCVYPEGQLLRAKDKVYYIDGACNKHYVSGSVYSKYKFQGGAIKAISQQELDAIPETNALEGLGCSGRLAGYLMWE